MKKKQEIYGISNNTIKKTELKKFDVITFIDPSSNKEITSKIYEDNYYNIVFYNADTSSVYEIKIAKIIDVSIDCISVLAIYTNHIHDNKIIDEIFDCKRLIIPINNIYKITEVDIDKKPEETVKKEVVLVSVLGLSTEVIKSVIVRLRMFDDDIRYRATPVDMIVGNVYNVSYYNKDDNTVYEVKGTLVSIDVVEKFSGNDLNGFVRPEETVGCNNTIYNKEHFYSLKKDYPEGESIRFLFDSSDPLEAHSDYVYLKDIRSVELIKSNSSNDGLIENNCPYKNGCYRLEHNGEDPKLNYPGHNSCCDCCDETSIYPNIAHTNNFLYYPPDVR